MSGLGAGLLSGPVEEVNLSPASPSVEPQTTGSKDQEEKDSIEESREVTDDEEEVISSARLEPCTLPWPVDRDRGPPRDDGAWSDKAVSEPGERDTGISTGSQYLSQEDSDNSKGKWRESMPEGERWRDDEMEVQMEVQRKDKGDGSLADDEEEEEEGEEEEEEEEEQGEGSHWMSEKAALGFTPRVTIVRRSSEELPEESRHFIEKEQDSDGQMGRDSRVQYSQEWTQQDDKFYLCDALCGERLKVILSMLAAAVLFPLLVWAGYALLPFDPPVIESTPLRVVYTLRCSFFAIFPILLGVVVEGVARLRYNVLTPLYQSAQINREVAQHLHYVNQSLALFLFYFLQLAVMATYIGQHLVKLVPLLTIIFAFGRLIYWLCLCLGSSIRGLGFGFSFFPILVMLGANLYYICSSLGPEAVFDVAGPTEAPRSRQNWWG